jgi:hypothetical protein
MKILKIAVLSIAVAATVGTAPALAQSLPWQTNWSYGMYSFQSGQFNGSPLDIRFCRPGYTAGLTGSLQSLCDVALGYAADLNDCISDNTTLETAYSNCTSSSTVYLNQRNSCLNTLGVRTNQYNALVSTYNALVRRSIGQRNLEARLRNACGSKCARIR